MVWPLGQAIAVSGGVDRLRNLHKTLRPIASCDASFRVSQSFGKHKMMRPMTLPKALGNSKRCVKTAAETNENISPYAWCKAFVLGADAGGCP